MSEQVTSARALKINGVVVGDAEVQPGDRFCIAGASPGPATSRRWVSTLSSSLRIGVDRWMNMAGMAWARMPWGKRVLVTVGASAVTACVISAAPLLYWRSAGLDDMDARRAQSLLNWLAADTKTAIDDAGDVQRAGDAVAQEPDVVSAIVLSEDGRVLAPAARATQVFPRIPVIDVPPAEVTQLRRGHSGDEFHLARAVAGRAGERRAIVWLTMRGSSPGADLAPLVVATVMLLLAVGLAAAAAEGIVRTTRMALIALSDEIRSCLLGEHTELRNPFRGDQAGEQLAATLSRLVARLRNMAGADLSSRAPGERAPATTDHSPTSRGVGSPERSDCNAVE